MQSIIDKINTLRDWHRTAQIKTHKGRNPDDLSTLLNQMELDIVNTICMLEKNQITHCDHEWTSSVAYKGAKYCTKCGKIQ